MLGPVGSGKSSLVERLKQLMEKQHIYVLKAGDKISPILESPLGLFDPERMGDLLGNKYGIAKRCLPSLISPWATKRLDKFDGDISKFSVVCLQPSKPRQIGIVKTEPGDENNQDISALVGKVDIRKLEQLSQDDSNAYSYSGGLNHTTQGMLEFVEMFKALIKVLHPLLARAGPVQCVASWGGGFNVTTTTRSTVARSSGAMPGGPVLSQRRSSTPSSMKRSCQRQTVVLDLPVFAMMVAVP